MDYQGLSNGELRRMLWDRFPGPGFKEVTEDNRQTVIALLEISEKETGRAKNVQPEDQ
jgi:hypothetical protein